MVTASVVVMRVVVVVVVGSFQFSTAVSTQIEYYKRKKSLRNKVGTLEPGLKIRIFMS